MALSGNLPVKFHQLEKSCGVRC